MKIFDYADLGSKRSWDFSMNGLTPEDNGIKPIMWEKDIKALDQQISYINQRLDREYNRLK